jgi:hypothetical protein
MARPSLIDDAKVRDRILLLIKSGNRLPAAAGACGVTRQTLFDWRQRAAKGHRKYAAFFEAVQRATDEGEVHDVVQTARAATVDESGVTCHRCGTGLRVPADQLLALAGNAVAAQNLKTSAASVAFQRLALRDPKHWAPRVQQTVDQEHNRLLDVAQRVLDAKTFRTLLEAYVAETDGDEPAGDGPSQRESGSVH